MASLSSTQRVPRGARGQTGRRVWTGKGDGEAALSGPWLLGAGRGGQCAWSTAGHGLQSNHPPRARALHWTSVSSSGPPGDRAPPRAAQTHPGWGVPPPTSPGLPTPLGGSESHSWAPDASHQQPRREDRCPAGRLASPQRPAAQASHRPPALAGECPRSSRMTSLPGTTTWETPYPRLLYRRRLRDPETLRPGHTLGEQTWGLEGVPHGKGRSPGQDPQGGDRGLCVWVKGSHQAGRAERASRQSLGFRKGQACGAGRRVPGGEVGGGGLAPRPSGVNGARTPRTGPLGRSRPGAGPGPGRLHPETEHQPAPIT